MGKKNDTAPGFCAPAPWLLTLLLTAIFLSPQLAVAEELPDTRPDESEQGLPAILHVGIPLSPKAHLVLAGTGTYGYLDPAFDLSSAGHRIQGRGAIAFSPLPELVFALDAFGRFDNFSAAGDDQPNLYGEPRLAARFQRPLSSDLFYGAELDVRFVGSEAPSIDLAATSPSLRGLFGARLADTTWLGAELGLHWDNSEETLPGASLVGAADRISVGASSFSSIPWGVGVSHRLPISTELLGELSGDILFGSDAPKPWESPVRLSLGARHPFTDFLLGQVSADVSLSARPDLVPQDLVPVEPRVSGNVALIWRLGSTKKKVSAAPAEKPKEEVAPPEEPKEPAIPMSKVTGLVIDEGGRPIPDAELILRREGQPDRQERTFANGTFEIADVPEGPCELVIKTPGYDEVKVQFAEGDKREKEVILYPSLPAGQVKGEVRDLRGNPLPETKIVISPGDKVIDVSPDGTFTLELAPGRYTVRFEHPDLTPQKRVIRVVDRGVVILNIALTR